MVKAQEPDLAALKHLFKELEFHSHLKELGPSEDTRARDYQALSTPEAVDAWLASIPPGAPVAVAIDKSAEGEFALDTVGLAWKRGEARAVPLQLIDQLRPLLEDAACPKITCDVKSVLLAFAKLGVAARGFAHDVMLYSFLLDADPGSCMLNELAHRRLDLKLGAAPEQHADYALELFENLSQEIDTRVVCASSMKPSSCRGKRAGARGNDRHSHRFQ
jgi:DNA polymerase-1